MHLYYSFAVVSGESCVGEVGGFVAWAPAQMEPSLKYHPYRHDCLTAAQQCPGQRMVGSLTGAVASQIVTEARDGGLRPVGHRLLSAMA